MAIELQVKLNGPTERLDAVRTLVDLRRVLRLMALLEASAARVDELDSTTAWRFSSLGLGSVAAAFVPERASANEESLRGVGLTLVRGFDEVEESSTIPHDWPLGAARTAERIAANLGEATSDGLVLTLLVNGDRVADAEVTRRAARHLRKAMKATHESIGSVVGDLGSVMVHGRRQAGIWPDGGGGRVSVTFDEVDTDRVAAALGSRVQVSGRLKRNLRGQLLSVKLRKLEVLPGREDAPPLTGMRGVAPRLTDLSAVEFIRSMRDSS